MVGHGFDDLNGDDDVCDDHDECIYEESNDEDNDDGADTAGWLFGRKGLLLTLPWAGLNDSNIIGEGYSERAAHVCGGN